jgi:acetyl-CoA synthetase
LAKSIWEPAEREIENIRMYQLMGKLGYKSYDEFYKQSIKDISWFWDEVVKDLGIQWFSPYHEILDLSRGMKWPRWFVGGELNITDSCVDKWLDDPITSQRLALIWEGEDREVEKFTYQELSRRIHQVAKGLHKQGIKEGDRIALYMPMIPETVIAMLAIAKIGAIFTPTFSGYGADAVTKRLEASGAKMLITADGFYRRGKIVPMKEEADKAISEISSVEKMVVVRRIGQEVPWNKERDLEWTILENEEGSFVTFPSLPMKSDTPLMLIYTSGTTGKPKGIVHTHSGFPIKAAFDAGYGMDLHQRDTIFWLTDMGWMMGPFLVFGSLLNGSTMMIYEGSPDYPQPNRIWEFIENYNLSHLGISPTFIRSIMKLENHWFRDRNLSTLRVIGSTGEPWNPEPWLWLFNQVGEGRIPIFNYAGGTEISGGILGNILLKPIAPAGFNGPIPGMDSDAYDACGKPVRNEVGELVIKQPWVGMADGFWEEPERYEKAYWNRWSNTWVHGDWVEIDKEGTWFITGRSDDTLNIAGKRLGPIEIESILVEHPAVIEAGTIGVPDEIKGEDAACFVVIKRKSKDKEQLINELMDMMAKGLGKALKPKSIHIVNELPKTRNAKVLRRVIRSAYLGIDLGDLSALENPQSIEEIKQIRD